MSYSVDLRARVINFVRSGGSKVEAARRFNVSRGRVYAWLALPEDQLAPGKPGPKTARKVDMQRLAEVIAAQPGRLQKELAAEFGVKPHTIHYALKRLKITRKKNSGATSKVICTSDASS